MTKPREYRWYQFSLAGLLIFTTIACIAFAILGAFGMQGTVDRIFAAMFFAAPFTPVYGFLFRWWNAELEANPGSKPIRDFGKIVLMFLVGEWIGRPKEPLPHPLEEEL